MSIASDIYEGLSRGGTVPSLARTYGVSESYVGVMVEHFRRLGILEEASSLCSSNRGACTPGQVSEQARLACAGCPLG